VYAARTVRERVFDDWPPVQLLEQNSEMQMCRYHKKRAADRNSVVAVLVEISGRILLKS